MPINLVDRQRALARVGAIRIGEKRVSSGGKQYPAARDTFRFTSPNKRAMEMLHREYGGVLRPWADEPGQWELLSEANTISVLVDVTFSVEEDFTRYDGKTRTHLCDGVICKHLQLRREGKKIVSCEDRGEVPCLCDPEGLGTDLDDDDRGCDLSTTLRVMIPATNDVVLWQLSSKGKIFNKEVHGTVETMRAMGLRQGYCLLTIHQLTKHRGNEVSKFAVPRLTLDPNPPNFVAALMANTPTSQARALIEGANLAPSLTSSAAPAIEARKVAAEPEEMPEYDGNYMLLDRQPTVAEHKVANAYLKEIGYDRTQFEELKQACGGIDYRFALLQARRHGLTTPDAVKSMIDNNGVPVDPPAEGDVLEGVIVGEQEKFPL